MAEVTSASTADYFLARHSQAIIFKHGNYGIGIRFKKAWPSGSGVKLCIGVKENLLACRATIQSLLMIVPILAGEGSLSALTSQYIIFLGGENFPPLVVCF